MNTIQTLDENSMPDQKRIHILLSDTDSTVLSALAARKGVTVSDYIRMHVREAMGRCNWCGTKMKMREWKTGEKRAAWTIVRNLTCCPECRPIAEAERA